MTARVANRNFVAATREEGKQSLKNVMVASRIVTEDKNWCIHVYLEEEFEWSIFQWRTGRWSKGRRMLPKKCILGRLFSLFPWTQSHSKRPSQITFWFVLLRSLVYISCRRHRMWSFWWHANTELLYLKATREKWPRRVSWNWVTSYLSLVLMPKLILLLAVLRSLLATGCVH